MSFSVITAVKPGGEHLLAQAYRCLADQTHGDWEWLIQLDGPEVELPKSIAADPRVSAGANGRSFGAAVTRNMALSRASGEWIIPLDHDDLLLPEALEVIRQALVANPEARGAAFAALVYDGQKILERSPALIEEGLIKPGVIPELYLSRGGHTGLHYNAVCLSHRLLLQLGGWPGVASNEDSQLLAAFTQLWPIVYLPRPLLLWVHHAQQTHRSQWFDSQRPPARRLAVRRLAAMSGVEKPYTRDALPRASSTAMSPSSLSLAEIGLGWLSGLSGTPDGAPDGG